MIDITPVVIWLVFSYILLLNVGWSRETNLAYLLTKSNIFNCICLCMNLILYADKLCLLDFQSSFRGVENKNEMQTKEINYKITFPLSGNKRERKGVAI